MRITFSPKAVTFTRPRHRYTGEPHSVIVLREKYTADPAYYFTYAVHALYPELEQTDADAQVLAFGAADEQRYSGDGPDYSDLMPTRVEREEARAEFGYDRDYAQDRYIGEDADAVDYPW